MFPSSGECKAFGEVIVGCKRKAPNMPNLFPAHAAYASDGCAASSCFVHNDREAFVHFLWICTKWICTKQKSLEGCLQTCLASSGLHSFLCPHSCSTQLLPSPQPFLLKQTAGAWARPCQSGPCSRRPSSIMSAAATWRAQQRQSGEEAGQQRSSRPSGAFCRKLAVAQAPFRNSFLLLQAPAKDEQSEDTAFAFANMRFLLHTVAKRDSALQMLFERNQGTALRAIWSQDECTAGNVLATEARQKVTFLYVSFQQYREALVSPRAWMAISCLTHEQVQRTKGGMAAITAVWLREWARQDLRTPFQVHGVDVCVELATFLADFEAMKESFAALGSSGIRPCFLCENVVMKGSPAPDRDPHFCSISEWDVTKFRSMKHEEVVGFMDDVFAKLPELNASALQLRERCSGFHILRESLWGCPTGRHLLKLDMVMNDNMHCYYAQGIASQELVLFTSAVCEATGFSVAQLGKSAADAGWLRPACYRKHGESKQWLARLFRESLWKGNMFKGSASQCESLVLLIRWYAVALQWNAVPALRKQYESFKQLALCADALKSTSRTKAWDSLATVQRDHMRCFLAAYPDGQERPKHHHRLHLPEQYKKLGFQCGCWATESKHRMYKGDLARQVQHFIQSTNGGVELSKQLLPKLLLRHCGLATENPLLLDGLWKLEQTVSAQRDCIASSFALGDSVVAKQLRARAAVEHGSSLPLLLRVCKWFPGDWVHCFRARVER